MLLLRALCLLALAVPSLAAPTPLVREPGWHSLRVWRQPQGLPQNTVVTLLQTRDGYIWVGTKGGVARFDGVRFTVFDDSDHSGLRENEVSALAEGDDGRVWIATYGGGVGVHRNGRLQIITSKDGLAHDYTTALLNDRRGGMWIGTEGGVSIHRGGKLTSLGVADGLASETVRSLFRDHDGAIWVGGDRGALSVYKDGRFEVPVFTGPLPTTDVSAMHRDSRGVLWVATADGLFRLREGSFTRYARKDGLSADRIRRVIDGPNGSLWVVTSAGLDHIPRPEDHAVRFENMAALANLSWGLVDHEGSLWVGSLNGGLTRLGQGHFTTYTPADGLLDEYVSTVLEDRGGNVWVGTANGLMRFVDGHFASHAGALKGRQIFSMAQDRAGHLWVGTDRGLFHADVGDCTPTNCRVQFTPLQPEKMPVLNARVILEDAAGALWLGLDQDGLVKYEGGRFTRYTAEDGLPSPIVRALARDAEGTLWIGTRGGLARLRDGRLTTVSDKAGLVNDGIQALYLDGQGILWIATRQGVSRLQNGSFHSYTTAHGLFSNLVYSFVEDGRGSLWMTCSKGIFRVRRQELEAFAAGKTKSVTSLSYGLEHGLASTVAVVGHHPAALRTNDGRLWFGTNGGLSIVDPSRLERNTLSPPVHIESVRVDGQVVAPAPSFRAGPGRGDLEIHYAGLSYLAPEKVRFQYRLSGYDRHWIDAGSRRVAYYTNIPPARYRFQVRGCNNDGVWNEAGDGFEISLAPRLYQTIWFYALCVGLVAAGGAATQRWRMARLRTRERELSARVEEAVAHIKVLRGLLPVCASCKKIRDDKGYWSQMETYIHEHSHAEFSHSICPDCMQRLYPEFIGPVQADGAS